MVAQITVTDEVAPRVQPSVWGLSPTQLHDRFWAARGVQVVRQGQPSEIVDGAELFLLTDPRSLAVFPLTGLLDRFCWMRLDVMLVRLHDQRDHGYRERVVTDGDGRFVRFVREYGGCDSRLARVALTNDLRLARLWQASRDPRSGWRRLRREVPRSARLTGSASGSVFDRSSDHEVMQFMRHLQQIWKRPDVTIRRAGRHGPSAWVDAEAVVDRGARVIGAVWVGSGREVPSQRSVIGPAILWDDPKSRPVVESVQWDDIEPVQTMTRAVRVKELSSAGRALKRAFDMAFALLALAVTLPLYPLVMLAIWLEDGRPFFFRHRRETVGGREFGCLKFRSMRNDAEKIKAELARQNLADGPQFFIEEDPRLTRVGRLIRRLNIDELPQFFNVLSGAMSVVGPRPSPRQENQFCPPWREARLSVRPGVTGLWQVMRTRQEGLDFQEWIKYDLEYVQTQSWRLDLWIIGRTVLLLIRKGINQ
jgi:lipopolysaccharide/colanic/teichoic acid biosynthesis glycosyltransferase